MPSADSSASWIPTLFAQHLPPGSSSSEVLVLQWDSIPTPLTSSSPQHSSHVSDGQAQTRSRPAGWWQSLDQDWSLSPPPVHLLPEKGKGSRGYGVMKSAQPLPQGSRQERVLGVITGISLFSRGKNNHGKRLQLQLITVDCVTAA